MDATRQKANEMYGPGIAAFLDHPEIGQLIRSSAEAGETAEVVTGRLRNTEWWKRNEASAREWELRTIEDPATTQREVQQSALAMRNLAGQIGVTLDDPTLQSIAADALRFGWNEDEIRGILVAQRDWSKATPTGPGNIGETIRRARAMANDYMVPISDATLNSLSNRWLTGQLDEAGVRSYMEQSARARWSNSPQILAGLDRGHTVSQLVDPLRQTIAQTLEMAPEQVDFNDSFFARALSITDDKGATRMMNLGEVAQLARQHESFEFTNTAINEGHALANELVTMFGGR